MLEVRNIAFSYNRKKVLRDVSFVASPGEVVTIVGANGAGKTTLMRILATLQLPDSGTVMMDGVDALARPLRYRRQLGYLPERIALYDDMTVKEYLRYRALLKGEPAKRVRRRVSESVELCQIGDILRERIGMLSAGQRKRVAIADAMILRPRVLLLDDFLSGLDGAMRAATGSLLSSAVAFSSVIVTGHELEDLAKWTTRFLVLHDGVLSASVEAAGQDFAVLRERLDAAMGGGGQ